MASEFKSPYREVGMSASRALRAREGRKIDKFPGLTKALNASRKPGRKAGKCRCGAPKQREADWCGYCTPLNARAVKFLTKREVPAP